MALQLVGVAPASGAPAVLTAVLGPAVASVPIDVLRVVVGASLLIVVAGKESDTVPIGTLGSIRRASGLESLR
jgi:uncharacterized membrane protein